MIWKEGKIDGVRIGPVKKNVDQRGWLAEIFRADEMPESEMPADLRRVLTDLGLI